MQRNANYIGVAVIILLLLMSSWKYLNPPQKQPAAVEADSGGAVAEKDTDKNAAENLQPAITEKKYEEGAPKPKSEAKWSKEDLAEIQQRRSNAKFALASGFTAQFAFHAEYERYTTDLKSLGFVPMQNELNYKMGFINQFHPAADDNQSTHEDWDSTKNLTTDTFIGEPTDKPDQKFTYAPETNAINLHDYARYCERGCTASDQEFEMLVVFPLPHSDRVDVWIVNEKKEIQQVLDGTK